MTEAATASPTAGGADDPLAALAEANIRPGDPLYRWAVMTAQSLAQAANSTREMVQTAASVRELVDQTEAKRAAASETLGQAIRADAQRVLQAQVAGAIRGIQRRLVLIGGGLVMLALLGTWFVGWSAGQWNARAAYGAVAGQMAELAAHDPGEMAAWSALIRLNEVSAAEARPGACWKSQGGEACQLLLWRTAPPAAAQGAR